MQRVTVLTLASCWLVFGLGNTAIAAETAAIEFLLPAGLPAGVSLPIPGRFVGEKPAEHLFAVQHDAFGSRPVLVQREQNGRAVWIVAKIQDKKVIGARIQVSATPVDTDRSPGVTIVKGKGGLEFRDGNKVVMFYRREPHSLDGGVHVAANYIHPLHDLDGNVLTQDFPGDHKHHHGVFWAWHQLWVGKTRAGDPWINLDFLPVVKEARVVDQGLVFATLTTRVAWTSPKVTDAVAKPRTIVEERAEIRVFHASADTRHIDFRISLTAVLDGVRIGGSENVKGYSGFTVRMRPPREMVIHDSNGRLDGDNVGTRSHWADISGRFGKGDTVGGLSILNHPTYPQSPPRWLLRHYGMQNVAWPGRDAVPLPRGKAVVLENRLVVHRGNHTASRSALQQAGYARLAKPGR